VNWTNQAPVPVDASFGEIPEQMTTAPSYREVFAVGVSNCPDPNPDDSSGSQIRGPSHELRFVSLSTGQQFERQRPITDEIQISSPGVLPLDA
jgi:hypothetical protein